MTAVRPAVLPKAVFPLRATLSAVECLCLIGVAFAQADPGIVLEIKVPDGYRRIVYPEATFAGYIQRLPLKHGRTILDYRGTPVRNPIYNVFAVVDVPLLFKTNIEQCADWCMRFWVDYHRASDQLERLFLFDYAGNRKRFAGGGRELRSFLRASMEYSNSYSLKRGCIEAREEDLAPGDMIVQNRSGGIGHVSIIVDVCENSSKRRLYLMGYSFMPAQQFHIERARTNHGEEGWFSLDGYRRYLSEFLPYGPPLLRRFPKP